MFIGEMWQTASDEVWDLFVTEEKSELASYNVKIKQWREEQKKLDIVSTSTSALQCAIRIDIFHLVARVVLDLLYCLVVIWKLLVC
jgi:trehalose/maltose hydrolase-like predicted phosphorylase